ncbi:SCO2322 family protein [Streptomyces sp. NPDC054887]
MTAVRTRPAALLLVLGAALLALAGAVLGAGTAQAATGYRYWSFWENDGGEWTYATQGPAMARPADGDVIGFRFSVSEDSRDSARPRRAAGSFDAVCEGTPARKGTKRIAVVIDPGTAADAPAGERPPAQRTACARTGTDATAADALASVAKPLRYDSSALLCAISGYPRTGCGEQVQDRDAEPSGDASAPAPASSTAGTAGDDVDGGPSAGVLAGLAAVLTLGVAGVWQARRRRG